MRLFNDGLAVGLITVLLVAAPRGASAEAQATTSASTAVDDTTLHSRVTASLKKNAALAAREVDVDVNAGVVTLKGTVRTASEKAKAAQLATVSGVTEVRNQIVVDSAAVKSQAGKAMHATERAGDKTATATKDTAQKAGEKTKEAVSATGEAITDSWITAKVKTKFFDETVLKNSDINVVTNNHVVTLKGTVASSEATTRAVTIARGTEGVARVVNQLVVKAK